MTFLPVQVAQCSQYTVDLLPSEPRTRRHAELILHILRCVEQHATRRIPVAAGAARLLQVVFQRSRDIGVNHQPHIGLVDAHAEGIGGHDYPQLTADEALLYALFTLRRQLGVKRVDCDLLSL